MKRAPVKPTLQRVLHERFIWLLMGQPNPIKYTDGGPSDLNRSRKRAAAKRQRQARRAQRRSR